MLYLKKNNFLSKGVDLNQLLQGDQMYWSFPFSKDSLSEVLPLNIRLGCEFQLVRILQQICLIASAHGQTSAIINISKRELSTALLNLFYLCIYYKLVCFSLRVTLRQGPYFESKVKTQVVEWSSSTRVGMAYWRTVLLAR